MGNCASFGATPPHEWWWREARQRSSKWAVWQVKSTSARSERALPGACGTPKTAALRGAAVDRMDFAMLLFGKGSLGPSKFGHSPKHRCLRNTLLISYCIPDQFIAPRASIKCGTLVHKFATKARSQKRKSFACENAGVLLRNRKLRSAVRTRRAGPLHDCKRVPRNATWRFTPSL